MGGAFSPFTTTHLCIACEVVNSGLVDAAWLVPCGPRPDKPSLRVSAQQRYIQCEVAINTACAGDFPVFVSDHEVRIHHV